MGILSTLFAPAVVEPVKAIGNVLDELVTSDEERAAAELLRAKLDQRPLLAQMAINQVEAQHRSIFVAGWRPAIGWVCVFALCYVWVLRPMASDLVVLANGPILPPSDLRVTDLLALLAPMLGIGTLRTIEKVAGRAK